MSACTSTILDRSTSARRASSRSSTRRASFATRPGAARRIPGQKRGEAEREAEAIIAGAKADAERMAAEADAKLEDFIARRTKMAETKIAQAEAQALAEVRDAAAEAAVAAAEKVLAGAAKGSVAGQLVARGIEDVKKKLN